MQDRDDRGVVDEQPEQVGSVAEEATKLFAAFSEWAQHQRGESADGEPGGHGSTCGWCPLCRAVDLVRQTSPEVRAQVADAASALLQVAAGWLASVATPDPQRDGDAAAEEVAESSEPDSRRTAGGPS